MYTDSAQYQSLTTESVACESQLDDPAALIHFDAKPFRNWLMRFPVLTVLPGGRSTGRVEESDESANFRVPQILIREVVDHVRGCCVACDDPAALGAISAAAVAARVRGEGALDWLCGVAIQ